MAILFLFYNKNRRWYVSYYWKKAYGEIFQNEGIFQFTQTNHTSFHKDDKLPDHLFDLFYKATSKLRDNEKYALR